MTSLIDVIFLLLLFFMLTSTFTKFAELPFSTGGAGASAASDGTPPLFLAVRHANLTINGAEVGMNDLLSSVEELISGPTNLLISLTSDVDAQRLVDVLVALDGSPDLTITVLR